MATQSMLEIVRCPKCNNVVPKQVYCRKCGQVLLNAMPITSLETANNDEDQTITSVPQSRKSAAKASVYGSHSSSSKSSAYEQYRQFRRENKLKENARLSALDLNQSQEGKKSPQKNAKNDTPEIVENDVPEVEETIRPKVEVEVTPVTSEKIKVKERKHLAKNDDLKPYNPDPYAKEIVEKMAKQVKYEVNLVQLFKDGQVPEEIFTRLFNSMADEINGLIARREEITKELNSLMKGYKSTLLSAQQGMKLLDLRKSLDDVSEEEHKVKAAALNWDINHYGERISEGRLKADYLRSLGTLIPVEEVNDLNKITASCMDATAMKHVNDGTREKIKKAMQEASSILNEIYSA